MSVTKDKKNGKWRFDVTEKKTRKHICKTGFETKSEAKQAEEEARNMGEFAVQGRKTLYEVINEKLDEVKESNPESTYDAFSNTFRLHIKDILVNKPIKNYTRNEITEYFKKLSKSGRSNHTINKVKSFLVNCFNFAVANQYIPYNPILFMKSWKHETKDVTFWTYEEYKKAMECEEDYMWRVYWSFCMITGIRKGERVFTWNDLDLDKGLVTINKHIYDAGNSASRNSIKKGRKNNKSLSITLNESLVEELKKYKEYCKKFDGFSEDWYVFGMMKPLARTTIARRLDALCEKANVTRITPHGLRHSCVSVAFGMGFESQIIASRIGDTVQMVNSIYGHLKKNADKPISDLFEQLGQSGSGEQN